MKPLTPNYRTFTYKGQTHTLQEWSKITKISYNTLYARLKRGYELKEVFGDNFIKQGRPQRVYTWDLKINGKVIKRKKLVKDYNL